MYTPRYFFSADDHVTSSLTQELTAVSGCTVNTTDARTGAKCLQLSHGNTATFGLPVGGKIGWVVGFALKPAAAGRFLGWEGSGSNGISVTAAGAVTITPGGSTSAAGVLPLGVWSHVEVFLYIRGWAVSPPLAIAVRLNGVTVVTGGQAVEFSGDVPPTNIVFLGAGTPTLIDDIVLGTTDAVNAAQVAADWQGDLKVFNPALSPGTFAQWTPVGAASNLLCVDDTAGANGDTNYVVSSTPGAKDTFALGSLPVAGRVVGVHVAMNASTDVSTAQLKAVAKKGSAEAQGPSVGVNVGYAQRAPTVFTANPATGLAWLDSDIAGAEVGYVLV